MYRQVELKRNSPRNESKGIKISNIQKAIQLILNLTKQKAYCLNISNERI